MVRSTFNSAATSARRSLASISSRAWADLLRRQFRLAPEFHASASRGLHSGAGPFANKLCSSSASTPIICHIARHHRRPDPCPATRGSEENRMQHHLDTEAAHFVFKEGKGRYLERSRHNENCSHRSGLFTSRPIRYGEGAYGEGRFGGPEQIIVLRVTLN